MGMLQIRVIVDRPLTAVFDVYTSDDTLRWCSFIRSARWDRGKPWEVESRLVIETDDPHAGIIDQVLTRFERNSRIDFISHFGGITLLTHVSFRAVSERQAEINSRFEFVGVFSRVAGFAVGPAIENSGRRFFDELKRACERMIPETQAANPSSNP